MLNIIFYSLIGLSFLILIFIVYRKLPVLNNLTDEEMSILSKKKGFFQRIKEINYKKYWFDFVVVLEKLLRKLKIFSLKIDNLLNKWIKFLRMHSQMMAQKSKDWIKQKEIKKRSKSEPVLKENNKIKIEDNEEEKNDFSEEQINSESELEIEKEELEDDNIPLEELQKPLKEEQKWINLIIENPKNITAYKFLGLLYWKQHNYTDAKKSLEMAVKLGSKDKKVKDVLKKIKKTKIM